LTHRQTDQLLNLASTCMAKHWKTDGFEELVHN